MAAAEMSNRNHHSDYDLYILYDRLLNNKFWIVILPTIVNCALFKHYVNKAKIYVF